VESKEEIRLRAALRLRLAQILYKNNTIPNETVFISLTTAIFENRHVRHGTTKQWTFFGAFYFSTLVVTLIGNFSIRLILTQISIFRLWTNNPKNKYEKFSFSEQSI
jgi:hypothetical protein